jgi:hypothetical protein
LLELLDSEASFGGVDRYAGFRGHDTSYASNVDVEVDFKCEIAMEEAVHAERLETCVVQETEPC